MSAPVDLFRRVAMKTADAVGQWWSFLIAVLVIVAWAATGPIFHYVDTWQLVINTGTTIVTFIMVFLIQSTQNRDAKAVHLKLDELIRAVGAARNNLLDLEELPEEELEALAAQFASLKKRASDPPHGRREKRSNQDLH